MAKYLPPVMAQFKSERMTLSDNKDKPITGQFYHFTGNVSGLFALAREIERVPSKGGANYWYLRREMENSWAGLSADSAERMIESGNSRDAQAAFDKALGELTAKGLPASMEYRVTGGAWSVPRALMGHPKAAMYRPRTALPPKNIEVCAAFSSYVNPEDVARPLAKIARALWQYQQRGGAVSLTVHYSGMFRQSEDGNKGAVISLRIPLSNISAIATACSVQLFRVLITKTISGLSGADRDGLPVGRLVKAGAIQLRGDAAADARALKSIGIE